MKKRHLTLLLVGGLILYLLFVLLPYRKQGEASQTTKEQFRLSDFTGETESGERAALLCSNAEALTERLRLIHNAKERILLSTFDFQADNSGKLMLAALRQAAARGVEVSVLIDGFSYLHAVLGSKEYFTALGSLPHAEIRVYNLPSLLAPTKAMARLHDKYLLVDDTAYLLGGRNTYDYFLGEDTNYQNYDWDILICQEAGLSSSSLSELSDYFFTVWSDADCTTVCDTVSPMARKKTAAASSALDALYEQLLTEHADWLSPVDYTEATVPVNRIRLLTNPVSSTVKEPVLFYQMTELMRLSGEPVVFHTPYLLCNDYMEERLRLICEEASSVTVMTNSVANNGNPFGAADYQLHKSGLLDTGLTILEYDSGVSYHGKCFTIGNRLSAIGSFNWDMRSAYIDTEIMLVADSTELNLLMKEAMEQYEADALLVTGPSSYALKQEQLPSAVSGKKKLLLILLRPIIRLFRFLM